jgi:hypothetical protein
VAALVSLPLAVLAQTMAPNTGPGMGAGMGANMGMGQGQGMGPGRMVLDPASLSGLKTKLGITPTQEPLWKSYVEGVATVSEMRVERQKEVRDMPPAERIKTRAERQAGGVQVHEEVNQRRDALSRVLTPDQRTIFDREAPPMPMPPASPPR